MGQLARSFFLFCGAASTFCVGRKQDEEAIKEGQLVDLLAPPACPFPPLLHVPILTCWTNPFTLHVTITHTSCSTCQATSCERSATTLSRRPTEQQHQSKQASREQLETNDGYLNQRSTRAWTRRHGGCRVQCTATSCRALSNLVGAGLRGPIRTWMRENASWNTDMPACCRRAKAPASTLSSCPGHRQTTHRQKQHAAISFTSLSYSQPTQSFPLYLLSHAHHRLPARRPRPHPSLPGPHPPLRPLLQPQVSSSHILPLVVEERSRG